MDTALKFGITLPGALKSGEVSEKGLTTQYSNVVEKCRKIPIPVALSKCQLELTFFSRSPESSFFNVFFAKVFTPQHLMAMALFIISAARLPHLRIVWVFSVSLPLLE